ASVSKPEPAARLVAIAPAAFVTELSMDARLRRIWRRYAEPELRAIAGAKVGNSATVVAVVDREPGAYEGSRLREAFGSYLEDCNMHFVYAVEDPHAYLVCTVI